MTSKERILKALNGEIPDRVPWVENYVANPIMAAFVGSEDFVHCTYSQKVDKPGMTRIPPGINKYIPLDNLGYDLSAPRFAMVEKINGIEHLTQGLIRTKDDLKLLDDLPDPDDPSLLAPAVEYLKLYKEDRACSACLRTGVSNTYLSMGIELFCQNLVMEPGFVEEVLWRFSNWYRRLVKNVEELPFDFYWMPDDLGFGNAPMISLEHFRKYCIPAMKNVLEVMRLPKVYHSDGNIMPLIPDIIALGFNGIANFEPGPMDIEKVKRLYGDQVTIIGNIDLHYTLTMGTPDETYDEVRRRIQALAPGGRYILASANTLPVYVKPDNVKAMGRALLDFGFYTPEMAKPAAPPQITVTSSPQAAAPSAPNTQEDSVELKALRLAVYNGRQESMDALLRQALDSGHNPEIIINSGFIQAMEEVGLDFAAGKLYVPEMLVAALSMKKGLAILKPLLDETENRSKGHILMATVSGDLHDIGKNIVTMMLEGNGFQVTDIGINQTDRQIVDKVKEVKPHILGLSALLTTTMPEMKKVIDLMDQEGLRPAIKIVVGGAPVSQKYADQIRADGYALDAAAAVSLCRRLIAG